MRSLILLVALSAVSTHALAPNIVELTTANFDSETAQGVWFIKFYGPSCGFCKLIEPHFDKLAEHVAAKGLAIKLGRVNVREHHAISQKFGIGPLPGMKLLRDGKVYNFPDGRISKTPQEYVTYITETYEQVEAEQKAEVERKARELAEIEAKSDVVKLTGETFESQTDSGVWFIDFYGTKCGYCTALAPTWEKVATEAKRQGLPIKIAKVIATDAHVFMRYFEANPWPALKLYRDEKVYTFPEPRRIRTNVQEYLDWAMEGYKATNGFTPEHVTRRRDAAARKSKAQPKTEL